MMSNNLNFMAYDSRYDEYVGTLPGDCLIAVSSDVWSEVARDGVGEAELVNPMTWANCVDGEKVYIVPQNSSRYWGR